MIAAIIQARMGSTRLPGKTMMKISGKPLLFHVIERAKRSKLIEKIIVATTDGKEDDAIEKKSVEYGASVFRGSRDDVLDRYYQAARKYKADVIVRITADDPLKDPEVVDKAIKSFLSGKYDYVNNFSEPTYPEGLDVEVFSFSALEKAWKEAAKPSEREHVTPYIWGNPRNFRLHCVKNGKDLSGMRWTIDYPKDLSFARTVYKYLYREGKIFLMGDVLDLLQRKPEVGRINGDIERNEGYKKSLKKDG
jgi:spore coat polysaccharide biosynthesis protein SpsF (cytidylyltransferase family)